MMDRRSNGTSPGEAEVGYGETTTRYRLCVACAIRARYESGGGKKHGFSACRCPSRPRASSRVPHERSRLPHHFRGVPCTHSSSLSHAHSQTSPTMIAIDMISTNRIRYALKKDNVMFKFQGSYAGSLGLIDGCRTVLRHPLVTRAAMELDRRPMSISLHRFEPIVFTWPSGPRS
jgi:hypothetical protein